MTSVTRHLLRVCLAAFCSIGLASCVVDNSYDFSEDNVDWTVNVLKGADLPLGSAQRISVGELISSFAKGILEESDGGYIVNVPAGVTVTGQRFGFVPVHGISKLDTDKIRVNSAEYHLDLKNDLPVALGITAEAVDASDNRVEGVLVECSGSVAAGTELSPSSTSGNSGRRGHKLRRVPYNPHHRTVPRERHFDRIKQRCDSPEFISVLS